MSRLITIRELIDANKRALDEKRLGAMNGDNCNYVSVVAPNCGCAIGVTLNDLEKEVITFFDLNDKPLNWILGHELIAVESEQVFYHTQALNDLWGTGRRLVKLRLFQSKEWNPHLEEFMSRHKHQIITEEIFREWINLLDRTFPE